MNYLVTSDRFFCDIAGGAYRIAWELAKLARVQGHTVTLFCGSTDADPPPGRVVVDDVQIVRYRFPSTSSLNPFRWQRHVAIAQESLARGAGDTEWDVIHAHGPVGALASYSMASKATRLLYTVHSPAILEQRLNWDNGTTAGKLKLIFGMPVLLRQERSILAQAHKLHVLSEYTRSKVTLHFGKAIGAKVQKIPWWTSAPASRLSMREARKKLGWPEDVPILFTLRRMVPRMGLQVLLDAAEALAPSHAFRLVLGGDGPQRSELTARSAQGSLAGRVTFPGRMTEEQIAYAYQASDAFVLPTTALECFGLIILEAFSNGLPVIASEIGAIPELVSPVLPGWLVKPGDPSDLRDRIEAFLDGRLVPPAPDDLVRFVAERFNRRRIEEKYLALIFGQERQGGERAWR